MATPVLLRRNVTAPTLHLMNYQKTTFGFGNLPNLPDRVVSDLENPARSPMLRLFSLAEQALSYSVWFLRQHLISSAIGQDAQLEEQSQSEGSPGCEHSQSCFSVWPLQPLFGASVLAITSATSAAIFALCLNVLFSYLLVFQAREETKWARCLQ